MELTPYDKLTPGERAVVDAIARNRRHSRVMAVLMLVTALLLLASAVSTVFLSIPIN